MRSIALLTAAALLALLAAACGPTGDCHVDGECKLTCKADPRKSDPECDNECTECVAGPAEPARPAGDA